MRPGVKGLSESIRVRSIIGRFLEHSRILYFANGGGSSEEVYIGSADFMHRSFDRRVEVVTPILDPEIRNYLKDVVLQAYLKDEVNARILDADGNYKKLSDRSNGGFDSQMHFVGLETPC